MLRYLNMKKMFTDKVLAPLVIGAVIGGVGYIFEYDPLMWIGSGIMGFGFFVMLRDG